MLIGSQSDTKWRKKLTNCGERQPNGSVIRYLCGLDKRKYKQTHTERRAATHVHTCGKG